MNGWLLKSGTGYYSSLVLTSAEWRGRYETIFIELETGGEAGGKGVGRASNARPKLGVILMKVY
jgi:hypothetical protein